MSDLLLVLLMIIIIIIIKGYSPRTYTQTRSIGACLTRGTGTCTEV